MTRDLLLINLYVKLFDLPEWAGHLAAVSECNRLQVICFSRSGMCGAVRNGMEVQVCVVACIRINWNGPVLQLIFASISVMFAS